MVSFRKRYAPSNNFRCFFFIVNRILYFKQSTIHFFLVFCGIGVLDQNRSSGKSDKATKHKQILNSPHAIDEFRNPLKDTNSNENFLNCASRREGFVSCGRLRDRSFSAMCKLIQSLLFTCL